MSRSTRTCSLRSAAAIALTSSFLITGFGASIAQAEPGPSAPLFGSLDFRIQQLRQFRADPRCARG